MCNINGIKKTNERLYVYDFQNSLTEGYCYYGNITQYGYNAF